MTPEALRRLLPDAPLIASVQASEGAAVDDPETLARMARDSVAQGVRLLRLQGVENIRAVREAVPGVPTIGLIKQRYEGSEVYITPTGAEVALLLKLGCEIIALDATDRPRPGGEGLMDLVRQIREGGALVMADCDSPDSLAYAARVAKVDLISTTLAGYTSGRVAGDGPDLDLVREAADVRTRDPHTKGSNSDVMIVAEGRYSQRWQVEAALQAGADAVVVGGALNDPTKQTRALTPRRVPVDAVAGFDLGGTWLRFGRYVAGEIISERIPTPSTREARLDWMREQIAVHRLKRAASTLR